MTVQQPYPRAEQPQAHPPQAHPPQAQIQPQPPQGYAPGAYPAPPSTGVRHWAWQLLYWMPIPLVSLVIVPLVLLGLRGGAVRNGAADEANSRAAINWTLTWLVAVVTTATLHVVLLFVLTGGGSVAGDSSQGIVLAITASLLGLAFFGGGILEIIALIRGWSAASRGEVAHAWLAIPFLRPALRSASTQTVS